MACDRCVVCGARRLDISVLLLGDVCVCLQFVQQHIARNRQCRLSILLLLLLLLLLRLLNADATTATATATTATAVTTTNTATLAVAAAATWPANGRV